MDRAFQSSFRCRRRRSPPAHVRDAVAIDRTQLAGLAILCIDNDLTILDGMETLLAGWGCRVLKAPDLATAVEALVESAIVPDALLVDYHLDEGNGIGAIAALRQRLGADLPAILITADRTPAGPRRGTVRCRGGAQQADQAGGAARAPGTMPCAARRGGVMRSDHLVMPGPERSEGARHP